MQPMLNGVISERGADRSINGTEGIMRVASRAAKRVLFLEDHACSASPFSLGEPECASDPIGEKVR
jgi:hypothetical protein